LFITCLSIVIVLHSLYRAAVSGLFSLVVLHIMHCKVACCTFHVWANEEGRKEGRIYTILWCSSSNDYFRQIHTIPLLFII